MRASTGFWISYLTRGIASTTRATWLDIASKYRPNLYDNSLKVPAIVKWPGAIQPGTRIEETTSNLDWYPTIVTMAGAHLPKNHTIRGRDLTPLLRGEEVENWDNDFYAEYSMINYCRAYMRCFRTPKWKLVRDFLNPDRHELYNLSTDPAESVNRIQDSSSEARQAVESLHHRILDRMQAINDPLLDELPGHTSAATE